MILIVIVFFKGFIPSVLLTEIPISYINQKYNRLLSTDSEVSSNYINVIDCYLEDDIIYVEADSVVLPISGIVTYVDEFSVEINSSLRVVGVESDYLLYQYYNAYSKLGEGNRYQIIGDTTIAKYYSRTTYAV